MKRSGFSEEQIIAVLKEQEAGMDENVEDFPAQPGIAITRETVRIWRNRFGPMFASDIRRQRSYA